MPPTFLGPPLPVRPSRRRRAPVLSRATTPHFSVCTGPSCSQTAFGKALPTTLAALLSTAAPRATSSDVGCLGECGQGPNVGVTPGGATPFIQPAQRTVAAVVAMLADLDLHPAEALVAALQDKERADAHFTAGRLDDAVAAYARAAAALHVCPRLESAARANWAAALLEMGQVDDALRQANQAVDCAADGVGAWKRKMDAHERRGEREMAVKCGEVLMRLVGSREREALQKRVRKLQSKWRW